jgi:hypothetical protein
MQENRPGMPELHSFLTLKLHPIHYKMNANL